MTMVEWQKTNSLDKIALTVKVQMLHLTILKHNILQQNYFQLLNLAMHFLNISKKNYSSLIRSIALQIIIWMRFRRSYQKLMRGVARG